MRRTYSLRRFWPESREAKVQTADSWQAAVDWATEQIAAEAGLEEHHVLYSRNREGTIAFTVGAGKTLRIFIMEESIPTLDQELVWLETGGR